LIDDNIDYENNISDNNQIKKALRFTSDKKDRKENDKKYNLIKNQENIYNQY